MALETAVSDVLPLIALRGTMCRLPLCEESAGALLHALLVPENDGAELADALAIDPSLALWAVHHAMAHMPSAGVPGLTVRELARWLAANLAMLLAVSDELTDDDVSAKPRSKAVATRLGQSAARDVARALDHAGRQELVDAPHTLTALLAEGADWVVAAGGTRALAEDLLSRLQPPPVAPNSAGGRRQNTTGQPARRTPARGANASPGKHANTTIVRARERWHAPPGFATVQFATVVAHVLGARQLELQFADRLEQEKLAALAEFAAGAGHEINNPLAVISGRAQLFLRHEKDPERRRELAVINHQARRVHEMIADLMLFARPPEPRRVPSVLAEIVAPVLDEFRARVKAAGAGLVADVGDSLPALDVDPGQVQVALRAVCDNALHALGHNGMIRITAAHTPGPPPMIEIRIEDDGPGFSPEERRHACDPYYSGRGAGRGLGVGLAKCWRIVTMHGGQLAIENGPAAGAIVSIRLPIAAAQTASVSD